MSGRLLVGCTVGAGLGAGKTLTGLGVCLGASCKAGLGASCKTGFGLGCGKTLTFVGCDIILSFCVSRETTGIFLGSLACQSLTSCKYSVPESKFDRLGRDDCHFKISICVANYFSLLIVFDNIK